MEMSRVFQQCPTGRAGGGPLHMGHYLRSQPVSTVNSSNYDVIHENHAFIYVCVRGSKDTHTK